MIKLRHVAGDDDLGKQVEVHRDRYVYSGAPWDLADGARPAPATTQSNSSSPAL